MKILIGKWESYGAWKSVILGLFDDDAIAKEAERLFVARHEGRNYYSTEYFDIELNKSLHMELN